ncbi:MAG: 4-hydroxybutyryl-CoA dehydratase [Oscillibacter sp.]|jgi:4-hydroxybutyryl-CoA dehydratase/vinylacetyl-CoA-Delta-isomerase|nr:4-hydroxybutyryl-CoA dehydratase [Oscillibacter sp.]MCI9375650.1 4-hydroxybutyryl-CoA dehydratase [Oscillibacter sp.]
MKTAQEYKDSLRERKIRVYVMGELLESEKVIDHPFIRGHVNSAAMTYALANNPECAGLMTATSHLTGHKINRFTHVHQSTDDLIKKIQMLRMISQKTGTCYQRCVGFDAMNATYGVTYEIDQAMGTDYHERFKKFLTYIQDNDLMVAGAMTDVKGDRSLRPSQQKDPDLFVHVVEKREDGVVLRGAKAHMTGMVNSHWMLIMPTMGMAENEGEYAISCAIPVDAPGVTHIFGRQTNDGRKFEGSIDQGNANYGIVGGECMTVLDNVFVPWENVFMCGETKFSGLLVERFACYHRSNYGGCKGGVSDVVIGAAALWADYQGTGKASHIKDKLNEMIHMAETLYACSLAASCMGKPTPSGAYFVDRLLANVGKHNVTKLIYDIDRLAQDIGGGIMATMPSEADLKNPEIGKWVEKYLQGVDGVPTEDRMRVGRLLENMTGGTALVESMHGAGSPQAQKVMYSKLSGLEEKKKFAAHIAGVGHTGKE